MLAMSQSANNGQTVNEILSLVQNLHWLIGVVLIIVAFALYMISFKRRVNKRSQKQVEYFKKNGKYIPELFVELNESKEALRFFIWGQKWKIPHNTRFQPVFHCRDGRNTVHCFHEKRIHFSFAIK